MANVFTDDVIGKLLEDYQNIPRDEERSKVGRGSTEGAKKKVKKKSAEEVAIGDMRELLDFVEKKITGKLTEQDEKIIKDKAEQWRQSISILRNVLLNK